LSSASVKPLVCASVTKQYDLLLAKGIMLCNLEGNWWQSIGIFVG